MTSATTKIHKRETIGDTPEKSLEAKKCRELLDCIYNICHKISVEKQLMKEYEEHGSHYGIYWLSNMKAKNKLIEYKNNIVNADLRRKMTEQLSDANVVDKVMKDMMLIELAIKGGRVIFSRDETSRYHIGQTVNTIPEIQGIIWQNPVNEGEGNFCDWLDSNEFYSDNRFLG